MKTPSELPGPSRIDYWLSIMRDTAVVLALVVAVAIVGAIVMVFSLPSNSISD